MLGEDSLLQLDPGVLVVVSVVVSKVDLAVGSEAASEAEIDPTFVEVEAASDIKAEAALVGEVGTAEVRRMVMAVAQHHPLMLLLDLEEEAVSVVGMAPLPLQMVV